MVNLHLLPINIRRLKTVSFFQHKRRIWKFEGQISKYPKRRGSFTVLDRTISGDVSPSFPNPDIIPDQNMRFWTPYFRPSLKNPYPFSDLACKRDTWFRNHYSLRCTNSCPTGLASLPKLPWSQLFFLIFLRMRELLESREAVKTRFAKRRERKTSGYLELESHFHAPSPGSESDTRAQIGWHFYDWFVWSVIPRGRWGYVSRHLLRFFFSKRECKYFSSQFIHVQDSPVFDIDFLSDIVFQLPVCTLKTSTCTICSKKLAS